MTNLTKLTDDVRTILDRLVCGTKLIVGVRGGSLGGKRIADVDVRELVRRELVTPTNEHGTFHELKLTGEAEQAMTRTHSWKPDVVGQVGARCGRCAAIADTNDGRRVCPATS